MDTISTERAAGAAEESDAREARLACERGRSAVEDAEAALNSAKDALDDAEPRAVRELIEGTERTVNIPALRRALEEGETNLSIARKALALLDARRSQVRAATKQAHIEAAYARYFDRLGPLKAAVEQITAALDDCDAAYATVAALGGSFLTPHRRIFPAPIGSGSTWPRAALSVAPAHIAEALEAGPLAVMKGRWSHPYDRPFVLPPLPRATAAIAPARSASVMGGDAPSVALKPERAALALTEVRSTLINFRGRLPTPQRFATAARPFFFALDAMVRELERKSLGAEFATRMHDAWASFGDALAEEIERIIRPYEGEASALGLQRGGGVLASLASFLSYARDRTRQQDAPREFIAATSAALDDLQALARAMNGGIDPKDWAARLHGAVADFGEALGIECRRIVEL